MGCILSFRWWAIGWRFDEVASLLDKGEEAFRILAGDAGGTETGKTPAPRGFGLGRILRGGFVV
jgi:hypothetical protein